MILPFQAYWRHTFPTFLRCTFTHLHPTIPHIDPSPMDQVRVDVCDSFQNAVILQIQAWVKRYPLSVGKSTQDRWVNYLPPDHENSVGMFRRKACIPTSSIIFLVDPPMLELVSSLGRNCSDLAFSKLQDHCNGSAGSKPNILLASARGVFLGRETNRQDHCKCSKKRKTGSDLAL